MKRRKLKIPRQTYLLFFTEGFPRRETFVADLEGFTPRSSKYKLSSNQF